MHILHKYAIYLDDRNSLLLFFPKNKSLKSLQLIQNVEARVPKGTRNIEQISSKLASLHCLPVKSIIKFKILLLTYQVLNNQSPSFLKDMIPYHPKRALHSQTADVLGYFKVEWEAFRPLFCKASSQVGFRRDTPSLLLRLGLILSILKKHIVRAGSEDPFSFPLSLSTCS